MKNWTLLVAEDEPLAQQQLCNRLRTMWPEPVSISTADNGQAAFALIQQHRPDVLFLDVKMPGLDGISLACEVRLIAGYKPTIVFVTAFNQHALDAFDTAAIDYLLKPINPQRLQTTIERIVSNAPHTDASVMDKTIASMAPTSYLQWLHLHKGNDIHLRRVEEVVYFQAAHKYVSAYSRKEEHLLRTSIKNLSAQLDPQQFWQIHRSLLVNADAIDQVYTNAAGHYRVRLVGREEQLPIGPKYLHRFKKQVS